ncbi:O-antigen ligase family protein [Pelotalea chapellei]|uniref:O-antigen ligase family protein n=1 Tax=Pelotalea chapellei TaxID=44671 RepID=A0ABS5U4L7_9BACT|nr:O-antigen ligase family protein [Pelotalea chapellei]MBT1070607.1 O-antigen ligase family protein [Pelotalea chapellei]
MNIEAFSRLLLLAILMLSIVFPATLQGIKIVLLTLVMGGFLILAVKRPFQMRWSKSVLIISFIFSLIGFIWSLYGEGLGNPGATRVLTVMAIYPMLFTLLGVFWKPGDAAKLQKAFLWFGFILILSQGLYIGSSFGLDGGVFKSLYGDIAVVDQGDDYFLFTLPSVASLIFFLPFFFIGFLFDSKFNVKYILLFLCSVVIVMLTGRRAIYLSFGLSMLSFCGIIAVGKIFFPKQVPKISGPRLMLLCAVMIAFILFLLSMGLQNKDLLLNNFQSIFDFQSNESNLERKFQYEALKEGISQNVIIGAGAGAAASYSRSFEQPWAYELFYVSVIYHYGILCFLVYLSGIIYLVWRQLKFIFLPALDHQTRLFSLCFLAGFFSFLIATATNPYIGKFDYMWIIFIPVMMVNSFNLTNEV